jgi:hypothetical protein
MSERNRDHSHRVTPLPSGDNQIALNNNNNYYYYYPSAVRSIINWYNIRNSTGAVLTLKKPSADLRSWQGSSTTRVLLRQRERNRYMSVGFYPALDHQVFVQFRGPRIKPIYLMEQHMRTLWDIYPDSARRCAEKKITFARWIYLDFRRFELSGCKNVPLQTFLRFSVEWIALSDQHVALS